MKQCLQFIVKILRFASPLAAFVCILLMPQVMASYPIGTFWFWLCLAISIGVCIATTVVFFQWHKVNWLYSKYATLVQHEVFREGQIPLQLDLRAALLGLVLTIAAWFSDRILWAAYYLAALPAGILTVACLIVLGVVCLRMWLATCLERDIYIAYAYRVFDPETGTAKERQDVCHIQDLRDMLTIAELDYILAKHKYQHSQDEKIVEAVARAFFRAARQTPPHDRED